MRGGLFELDKITKDTFTIISVPQPPRATQLKIGACLKAQREESPEFHLLLQKKPGPCKTELC